MDYDIAVIGTGPGGYHAAIRAAQLGKRVVAIEREFVGGVCLNVGCIPTKALLHVAEDLREARKAKAYGVDFGEPSIDLPALDQWKSGVVDKLTGGVKQLLKGNKVAFLEGAAVITGEHQLDVAGKAVTADKIIVATGSRPLDIAGFEADGNGVVDSTGALNVTEVPKRFVAIGGSAIGLEFADIYNALGSEVTVVELLDHIVPTVDEDVARELHKALERRGIKIMAKTKAVSQKKGKDALEVTVEVGGGKQEKLEADKILVAVGRRPNSDNLGLEEVGVKLQDGYIPTNDHMQSSVANIYAIGDVARPPLLAHKAMKEGIAAAEHAAGRAAAYDTVVPSVIYTSPEVAWVGLTEREAREAGHEVNVGVFPLVASGRALTLGTGEGLVKVVGDSKSDLLLGFQMVGPVAGELVAEAALAIEMGATLEDVALTQHAHPTLSEAFMEAAEAAHGRAIHVASKRRR